jgi:hypothetical protein
MKTQWSTGSMRRKCSAWSRISLAVRLRPNFIVPVAQKLQVSGQPDCELTHSDRRPSAKRISTASIARLSWVLNRALTVPSRETASRWSASDENGTRSASCSRNAAGRSVIAS